MGIISAGDNLRDPQLVGAAVGVGLLSSALPGSLELEALRRLPSHIFSIVLSLEPAVAAFAGVFFLHEHLQVRQWFAIALVVLASAGRPGGTHRPGRPMCRGYAAGLMFWSTANVLSGSYAFLILASRS